MSVVVCCVICVSFVCLCVCHLYVSFLNIETDRMVGGKYTTLDTLI